MLMKIKRITVCSTTDTYAPQHIHESSATFMYALQQTYAPQQTNTTYAQQQTRIQYILE